MLKQRQMGRWDHKQIRVFKKRISIFTGHFGSGKTEVAVNYAMQMLKHSEKIAIVDFDIVNPYFRTADAREELEKNGIRVIAPLFANTNVDVPALSPEVNTLFEDKGYHIVFDVGGDDLGAKVLSRYREEIVMDDFQIFFVVNTKRPMTNTVEKIEEMLRGIEYSSRLKVDGLVNNTNLLQYTSVEDILEGHEMLNRVSEKLHKPLSFTSGLKEVLSSLEGKIDTELLYMVRMIEFPI